MDQALRNIVRITGDGSLSLSDAVAMVTRNPARSTGAAVRKGQLAPGYDADLVLLDEALAVQATIRGGVLVYASEAWRELLSGIPAASAAPTSYDFP
jgi:N-acetylglucosamine-6-phosphate deacetylase